MIKPDSSQKLNILENIINMYSPGQSWFRDSSGWIQKEFCGNTQEIRGRKSIKERNLTL